MADQGINLPSQTMKIRDNLTQLLEESKPKRLIILGDLKHSVPKISAQEWQDIPLFFDEITAKVDEIEIVPGNHDGGIARFVTGKVKLAPSRGLLIQGKERIGLFHGHAWPSPKLFEAKTLVMGHNHPAIQFKSFFGFRMVKPVWIKSPIDRKKLADSFLKYRSIKIKDEDPEKVLYSKFKTRITCSQLIIMPAFNDLLGGIAFNAKAPEEMLGPLLRAGCIDLEEAETFLMDGTFLGALKDLKKFS
jgi:metallophosphoesterase superfamily enzyme